MRTTFSSRYAKLGHPQDPKIKIRPALRINTLKAPAGETLKLLRAKKVHLEPISWLLHGYYYEAPFSLGSTPEYLLGYYHLQGSASQLPVEILDPQAGEHVLDMAAAPGGKSAQIACHMKNEGILVCCDIRTQRLTALRNNLMRLGVSNTIVYRKDARFVHDLGRSFDKILLDAPCSGNFASDPDWDKNKSLVLFKEMAKTQRQLLKAAWKVLKPGGVLLYSTCSLEPEENECNINWFLETHEDAQIEKIGAPVGSPGLVSIFEKKLHSDVQLTRRLWPSETKTEGFFLAKLRKHA